MASHDWPGNVRELVNVASVAATLADEPGAIDDVLMLARDPDVAEGPARGNATAFSEAKRAAVGAFERDVLHRPGPQVQRQRERDGPAERHGAPPRARVPAQVRDRQDRGLSAAGASRSEGAVEHHAGSRRAALRRPRARAGTLAVRPAEEVPGGQPGGQRRRGRQRPRRRRRPTCGRSRTTRDRRRGSSRPRTAPALRRRHRAECLAWISSATAATAAASVTPPLIAMSAGGNGAGCGAGGSEAGGRVDPGPAPTRERSRPRRGGSWSGRSRVGREGPARDGAGRYVDRDRSLVRGLGIEGDRVLTRRDPRDGPGRVRIARVDSRDGRTGAAGPPARGQGPRPAARGERARPTPPS